MCNATHQCFISDIVSVAVDSGALGGTNIALYSVMLSGDWHQKRNIAVSLDCTIYAGRKSRNVVLVITTMVMIMLMVIDDEDDNDGRNNNGIRLITIIATIAIIATARHHHDVDSFKHVSVQASLKS